MRSTHEGAEAHSRQAQARLAVDSRHEDRTRFQKRHFAGQCEIATKAAGLDAVTIDGSASFALHCHDFRGTAVTILSEAGCTPQKMAAITGHLLKRIQEILGKYLALTRALAEGAIAKFENSPRRNLQTGCKLNQPRYHRVGKRGFEWRARKASNL